MESGLLTMADDLNEIHGRIAFCRAQNTILAQSVQTFVRSTVAIRYDASTPPWVVAKAKMTEDVPIGIRSQTGQIINELRSCLDGLACTLAERNGKTTSGTYFPISKDSTIFAVDGPAKTKKLSPADQVKLLKFQTHGDAEPELFGMHELDRNRKHIRLSLQIAEHTGFSLNSGGVSKLKQLACGPLSTGVEESLVAIISDRPFGISFLFDIVFADPPQLSGCGVIAAIHSFSMEAERIVSAFD